MKWFLRFGAAIVLALGLIGPALAATTDGKTPDTAIPLPGGGTQAMTGSMIGSNAGSFAYYTIAYPGDESVGVLTLSEATTNPVTAASSGINLYQDGNLIGTANALGKNPGTNSLSFSSKSASPILVQVYNYVQDTPVDYQLSLSGSSTTTAAPAPVAAPQPAPTTAGSEANPIALTTKLSGSLTGSSAGAYQYYTINYPGDKTDRTVTLTFWSTPPYIADSVFLNVYQNGTQLGSTDGSVANSSGQIAVTFSSDTAGPIVIQIANYSPDNAFSFNLEP
jgi:hypothetical protein